ncbi:MAG: DUF1223 domain-containing protein [Myxococcales bacterium]|nr:DUF1223 domain-containing protein [Myxococcales bacterium]
MSSAAQASPERVQSGATRISLLELYTSEGCSSCPPAEELVSSLAARAPGQIVALAFHVDYWDDIASRAAVQTIALPRAWNRAQLALVAFVEDERGEVLDSVRLPLGR